MRELITNKPIDQKNAKRYFIGIDPGVDTGFAVWDSDAKDFLAIETVKIHEAIEWVSRSSFKYAFFRVEDARLRKWVPKEKDIKQRIGRAKGAGSVSRDAQIWEEFFKSIGADYEMVPPKNNKTKVSSDYFKKISGWEHRTSQHGRDAAMLVINKTNLVKKWSWK